VRIDDQRSSLKPSSRARIARGSAKGKYPFPLIRAVSREMFGDPRRRFPPTFLALRYSRAKRKFDRDHIFIYRRSRYEFFPHAFDNPVLKARNARAQETYLDLPHSLTARRAQYPNNRRPYLSTATSRRYDGPATWPLSARAIL